MITGKDIENCMEIMEKFFPKKKNNWTSDIFVEVSNTKTGDIYFFNDMIQYFREDDEAMKNFAGENWQVRVTENFSTHDLMAFVSDVIYQNEIKDENLEMLNRWLMTMFELIANSKSEILAKHVPDDLRKIAIDYSSKGIFPKNIELKKQLVEKILAVDNAMADNDNYSLWELDDVNDDIYDIHHGIKFSQENPGDKIQIDKIWFDIENQYSIDADKKVAICSIDEDKFADFDTLKNIFMPEKQTQNMSM